MKFSSRVEFGEPGLVAKAQQRAQSRAQLGGVSLVNLADSNPTRHGLGMPGLPPYQADPRGPMPARKALARFISRRDNRAVDPDNLYLLSSTSQGYAWLFKLLADPGQVVLVPSPGYPLVADLARLESVRTEPYFWRWLAPSWELDLHSLRSAQQQCALNVGEMRAGEMRAVVVINPNNPTGSYVPPSQRQALLDFCATDDLPLIADEVFFSYALRQAPPGRQRLVGEDQVLTFALDGLSKNLAAPGVKIAWLEVSGPAPLVAQAKERLDIIADAYLPFSDVLAGQIPQYLSGIDAQVSRVCGRVQDNLDTLQRLVSGEASGVFTVLPVEGGWNALLRFPSHIDEDALVTHLIQELSLVVQPGYFFDLPLSGIVSISLLLEPEVFAPSVKKLLAAIDSLV